MSSNPAAAAVPPPSFFAAITPFLPTYLHLIITAIIPIYAGAHAALRRPLNTLSSKQLKALRPSHSQSDLENETEEEDEEDEEPPSAAEKLTATDAMMFPVTAGALLGSLYLILKYIDDPTLLSKILTYYFCMIGVLAVGKAAADMMSLIVGYVFPDQYRDAQGVLYTAGFDSWKIGGSSKAVENPLPSLHVHKDLQPFIWAIRRVLRARWLLTFTLEKGVTKRPFWIGEALGPIIGVVVVGMYALGGKHWLLTNAMGLSFSYGAMQLLSPTTFPIATLLLGLLFCYDIFFVFYTPLMVTVATNLDVPIKLLFPRPGKTSDGSRALAMLGLGDVVLPGLLIAMALRWDLWRFYEIKRRALVAAASQGKGELSVEEVKALKPRYTKATGAWGTMFWDSQALGAFPKTYFNASLVGYAAGMIATLGVMHIFHHAQPALLYLVPAVLGSVWGTALVKGEAKVMWNYTEEGDGDDDEKKKAEEEEEKKKAVGPKLKGEVDETIISLTIVRRPAFGARRKVIKAAKKPPMVKKKQPPPVETEPEVFKQAEESLEESSSSDDEDGDEGSTSSGEVVEKPEGSNMWGTTVINQKD